MISGFFSWALPVALTAIGVFIGWVGLALLWQIYSRRCASAICFLQYGHRCGRGRTMSSTMAWRTAGRLG
jgi:hypothetical protein